MLHTVVKMLIYYIVALFSTAFGQTQFFNNNICLGSSKISKLTISQDRAIHLVASNETLCQVEIKHAASPSMLGLSAHLQISSTSTCGANVTVIGTKRPAFGGAASKVDFINYVAKSTNCDAVRQSFYLEEQVDTIAAKVETAFSSVVQLTITLTDVSGSFQCTDSSSNRFKLNTALVCDAVMNCRDESDERHCPNSVTSARAIESSGSNTSLPSAWVMVVGGLTLLFAAILGVLMIIVLRRRRNLAALRSDTQTTTACSNRGPRYGLQVHIEYNIEGQNHRSAGCDDASERQRLGEAPPSYDEATRSNACAVAL